MLVNGVEIDEAHLREAFKEAIPSDASFRARDVERAIHGCVPLGLAPRAADRLLQKMKRAGEIAFSNGLWFQP